VSCRPKGQRNQTTQTVGFEPPSTSHIILSTTMPSLTLHVLVLVVIKPNKKHTISEVETIENHFDTDMKRIIKNKLD
jgi:hypothetical protein